MTKYFFNSNLTVGVTRFHRHKTDLNKYGNDACLGQLEGPFISVTHNSAGFGLRSIFLTYLLNISIPYTH